MKQVIFFTLVLIYCIGCGRNDETAAWKKDEETLSQAQSMPQTETIPQTPDNPKPVKIKKKPGSDENTLVGITYINKNQISFLQGFQEIGSMVLRTSTKDKKYSMTFFKKSGAQLALLEECRIAENPQYRIIDRIFLKIKGDISWQYDPVNNICALIRSKKAAEISYITVKAWEMQPVKERIKIKEINPSRVYYQTSRGSGLLVYEE